MHHSIQSRRDVVDGLRQRSRIATADFYRLIGRPVPVVTFRMMVKPAGRDFFHVVDSLTGKVMGFRRDHNEACALARRLETHHANQLRG
ncbi:hypothetical protein IFT96_23330 [Pseudomonas fluorescens]|uniref:hypothetical protein n=1 Tax=Pseudomonas TaxID=286 RepID=UPI00177F1E39|nr:hypothetical protein [Pseudomonas paracarnis]MBD8258307.1 hypothetical protein [Pseudomonas fluorescens]MDV3058565.1 hypothetical protein [Pseudomonas paracarnis]QQU71214.1 hypothetical protein I6I45_04845 [Pseudomonas fluorescens]